MNEDRFNRPYFKACNHGCRARRPRGMSTNGGCRMPRLPQLREKAGLLSGYHDDIEVRRFARKVCELLDHIEEY